MTRAAVLEALEELQRIAAGVTRLLVAAVRMARRTNMMSVSMYSECGMAATSCVVDLNTSIKKRMVWGV